MDDGEPTKEPVRHTAPIFRAPKQVSRPKPPREREEMLGPDPFIGVEFQRATAISIAEARTVVESVFRNREQPGNANPLGQGRAHNDSENILKFLHYFDLFSHTKTQEATTSVSILLNAHPEFSTFERAQLGSLNCTSVDEARTLIPSLQDKIDDENLEALLNDIQNLNRQF
ncbi:hypothetical protein GQ43DRAFT_398840 [Delitschia confertaspora ATCC 74209]|uniref:RNA polymerase Rpb4/RPC9 core domain-containing protein n=1 Tax=Delitschia confertaspora ATCC 74209 TaxID=1513339 RepID=A0A9P4JHU0_9PLEO|nr:hypothetical protein GQ43DRAFT_398840 [Delitschia confertaspora ATCC 74209]